MKHFVKLFLSANAIYVIQRQRNFEIFGVG